MVERASFLNTKLGHVDESNVVARLRITSKPKPKLFVATAIPIWTILSSGIVIYNSYLYNTINFNWGG
jgi:hypothetical protein